MKKYLILTSLVFLMISCSKLSDLNIDPKKPLKVPSRSLFTNAQRTLANTLTHPGTGFNCFRLITQQWQECFYPYESNYDLTRYNTNDAVWDMLYRYVLRDFRESKNLISKEPIGKEDTVVFKTKSAMADLMEIMTVYYIATTFGNVPYSDAMDINNPFPSYDDSKLIFEDLLTRLDADLVNLKNHSGDFAAADHIYSGNLDSWVMFANSFKLKLALTLADIEPDKAKSAAEAAIKNGVFSSNADNAEFHYITEPPNVNPVWSILVHADVKAFVAASTLVDQMKSLSDPRLDNYFTKDANGGYSGGTPGANSNYTEFSKPGEMILPADFPALFLSYAEVEFLLAEAVERGYEVEGTAKEHYEKAIAASIEYWGGTPEEANAYLSKPEVNYSNYGNYKEIIGMQKWIDLYNRGWDAWIEWRRLDYPKLEPAVDAVSPIPVRFPYSINEQNVNRINYEAASAAIGGDYVTTKLWWDVF